MTPFAPLKSASVVSVCADDAITPMTRNKVTPVRLHTESLRVLSLEGKIPARWELIKVAVGIFIEERLDEKIMDLSLSRKV